MVEKRNPENSCRRREKKVRGREVEGIYPFVFKAILHLP